MKDKRSMIAQLIVDMSLLEKREIKRKEMIEMIKEVNDSKMIGHACRFAKNANNEITHIQKYRLTAVEKKMQKEKIEKLRRNGE